MRYELPDIVQNVIISPKRAGTTWLQALLGSYLCRKYNLPEENLMRLAELTKDLKRPVAITHDPQRNELNAPPPNEEYKGRRIVVLLRDPRDVIVSRYMLDRYRNKSTTLSIAEFVRENLASLLEFYEVWLTCERGAFLGYTILRYEDLLADTRCELINLIEFLGYDLDQTAVEAALEFASFANMQRLEQAGKFHSYYKINDMLPVIDTEARRTRRGQAGGYRDYLDGGTINWIEARLREYPALGAVYPPRGDT